MNVVTLRLKLLRGQITEENKEYIIKVPQYFLSNKNNV